MGRYRIRAVIEVNAIQWTGRNTQEICDLLGLHYYLNRDGSITIVSALGNMNVPLDWWIVVDGGLGIDVMSDSEFTNKFERNK